MKQMAERLMKGANNMRTSSDIRAKKLYINKFKWAMGEKHYLTAAKVLEFPFNPLDMNDEEFSPENTFKVKMLPEEFIRAARELYHQGGKFKDALDSKFSKLGDDVKAVFELDKLEIPVTPKEALTNAEIAVYNSYASLLVHIDIFRNVKSKNGKYTNKVIDMTKFRRTELGLEAEEETLMMMLGDLESALANKNYEIYNKFVNENEQWIDKTDNQKSDYVKNMSYSAAIIGYPTEKAILPIFTFRMSEKEKTKFEDKNFDMTERKDFCKQMAYIMDKDFISVLRGYVGGTEDKYPNHIEFTVEFDLVEDQGNKDANVLESYKQKQLNCSPSLALSTIYKKFSTFFNSMWDYSLVDEVDETARHLFPSFLTDYFKRNCPIYTPWTDERLSTHYMRLRQLRDFSDRFRMDELQLLEAQFKAANIDPKKIKFTGEIYEALEQANSNARQLLTQVPGAISSDNTISIDEITDSEEDLAV